MFALMGMAGFRNGVFLKLMTSDRHPPNLDFDSPWKDLIECYFEPFMSFFFPEASQGIDWTRPVEFLDKELQQVVRDAELGKRFADKLVKVYRLDGSTAWVLVHIEIQSQADEDFIERMYQYNYRIRDRYSRPVASFAVLADERHSWRPQQLNEDLFGCQLSFSFPTVKLLDYRQRWLDLEQSDNPFGVVVMAHLKTQETRHNGRERQYWKWTLIRRLYEGGWSRQDVINLFHFIDWLMRLPDALEEEFWQQVRQLEEQRRMRYVTTVERRAKQEGLEEGLQQGLQREISLVIRLLVGRFGPLSPELEQQVRSLTIDQVEALAVNLLQLDSREDLERWLEELR
jgi:hypothetical protein